jgi:hypothetical protein
MKKILLVISLLCILFLISCWKEKWNAYVYPYWVSANKSTWIIQKWFNTLEECRSFAIKNIKNKEVWDYECGYKCKFDSSWWMDICKKTEE